MKFPLAAAIPFFAFLATQAGGAQWLTDVVFGDRSNGNLTISASQTDAPIDATCSGTINTRTLSATNTGFAAGQVILIHQTRGSGAGNWELNVIQSYTAGSITTVYNLANSYAAGAQVLVVKQYGSVIINSGCTWTAKSWNGSTGGILAFMAADTVTVEGSISATGRGFRGSTVVIRGQPNEYQLQGESANGTGGYSTSANGSGGGGGYHYGTISGGGGGGHAAGGEAGTYWSGGNGPVGAGGGTDGNVALTDMVFGGAGAAGAPGGTYGANGGTGNGGYGGGIVAIFGRNITIATAGSIVSGGGNGANGNFVNTYPSAGGGGGAGGSILLNVENAALGTNLVSAAGGARGSGGSGSGATAGRGGYGGSGRIRINYGMTCGVSSNNPSWSAVLDTTRIGNSPPEAFSLLLPSDAVTLDYQQPTFSWEAAVDPDGTSVLYTLQIAANSDFTPPLVREITGLTATSHTLTAGESLPDGTYYWRVQASDGEVAITSDQSWSVGIDTVPPDVPLIESITTLLDNCALAEIAGQAAGSSELTLYVWNQGTDSFALTASTTQFAGNNFVLTPATPLQTASRLYLHARDAAGHEVNSRTYVMGCQHTADAWVDTLVHRDTGAGSSLRLDGPSSYSWSLAVNGGQPVTVRAWLRRSSDYSGDMPTVTLSGLGVNASPVTMTGPAEQWQELTITVTPNSAGVLNLTAESFSATAAASLWIDDISISQ